MEALFSTGALLILLTLIFLEIVLGVDNLIFISIVTNKLPKKNQALARNIGLVGAFGLRIALLFGISIIMGMNKPFGSTPEFEMMDTVIPSIPFTGKSIILFLGGVFLIAKSTTEIFEKFDLKKEKQVKKKKRLSFSSTVFQIILLDIVFSFDSILTAIGLVDSIVIIVVAMLFSMIIMVFCSGSVSRFINKFPSLQILALAFLILIGFTLLTEAIGMEIPKGYIYFAIVFSLVIELINIKIRKRKQLKVVLQ